MTIPTRSNRSALDAELADKIRKPGQRRILPHLSKSTRRPAATQDARRTRPKRKRVPLEREHSPSFRSTQPSEAEKILKDVEEAYVALQLGKSHRGRRFLELSDARSKAKFREDFARLALHADRKEASRARAHHAGVCNESRSDEFDSAHFKLTTADAALRNSTRIHAAAVDARERVDFELRALQQPIEEPR